MVKGCGVAFPQSSNCGLIEAGLTAANPTTCFHFRSHRTAASLKHVTLLWLKQWRPNFRSHRTAASLKPRQSRLVSVWLQDFRSHRTAASLKPNGGIRYAEYLA